MSRLSSCLFVFFTLAFFILTTLAAPTNVTTSASASAQGLRKGKASFFYVGLGACGKVNKNSDLIVALATKTYANGAHCNKKIQISYKGKTAVATVRDMCPSCGPNDLDMSPALFSRLEKQSKGVFQMSWKFL